MNLAYENCEQDHIDNEIRLVSIKTMQWTKHIYQLRKWKINKRMKLNTYLHECTLQWKNTLEIKEIFTSLRSKIYFTYKKEIRKVKASRMSLT